MIIEKKDKYGSRGCLLYIIITVVVAMWLASCTTYKCQPSRKSKDFAASPPAPLHKERVARSATIKKVKEGYLLTERNGFTVTTKLYECWPICYDVVNKN
jgi:hypothetical protein